MNKHVAIVVDWYGCYSLPEATDIAKEDYSDGLYMLVGKVKHQKDAQRLQYIGIAKNLFDRVNKNHERVLELSQECNIWLGDVVSFGIPGTKIKITDAQLDLAEWLHSYFLELPLNERKKEYPPSTPATVINRWWFKDYETLRKQRPHKDWPDVIDYSGKEYGAKVVWFGGKLIKWNPEDF